MLVLYRPPQASQPAQGPPGSITPLASDIVGQPAALGLRCARGGWLNRERGRGEERRSPVVWGHMASQIPSSFLSVKRKSFHHLRTTGACCSTAGSRRAALGSSLKRKQNGRQKQPCSA